MIKIIREKAFSEMGNGKHSFLDELPEERTRLEL
jgi:hypothetical protein